MEECDIDDPCVHVDLDKLPQYDRNHLINWLKYIGDCLKSLEHEGHQNTCTAIFLKWN